MAISRDGTRLAAAYHSLAVRVWDIASGNVIAEVPKATGGREFVAFSGNDRALVIVDLQRLAILDNESNRLSHTVTLPPNQGAAGAVTADGKHLLIGGGTVWSDGAWRGNDDYDLRLWQLPESVWSQQDEPTASSP